MERVSSGEWKAAILAMILFGASGSAIAEDFQHPTILAATPSSTCLECHDGVVASNVLSAPAIAAAPTGGTGGSHPVGRDYLTAQISGWAKLRPLSLLPPEIHLVDGRVECSSCHDLSTVDPPRLVLEMRQSRLCFACHVL